MSLYGCGRKFREVPVPGPVGRRPPRVMATWASSIWYSKPLPPSPSTADSIPANRSIRPAHVPNRGSKSGAILPAPTSATSSTATYPPIRNMWRHGTPATNIIPTHTIPSNAAVEKFAGKISPQITAIGSNTGKTPVRKSSNRSRLTVNSRATYVTSTTLAKSDVCNVSPMKGILSQRLALLMSAPNIRVNSNNTAATQISTCDAREKYRKFTLCTSHITTQPSPSIANCLNR